MKTYLLLCIFICSFLNSIAQRTTITFSQYHGLSSDNIETLSDVYHKMRSLNYHYFNLVGQNEMKQNSHSKLLKIAKARAEIITNYYKIKEGVSPENLTVVYGGQFPILSLFKQKSMLTASGKIVLDEDDKQCYNYNTNATYPILSNNGNKFYFTPNAFETLNGKQIIDQNIDICLWEFIDKKSLVYSGLTTEANGKMLETAGSFYIEAKYNGEELKLRKGESYSVEIPFSRSYPDMFTYYGGEKDGIINWTVDKNEPVIVNDSEELSGLEPEENVVITFSEENYEVWKGENEYESEQAVDFYEMSAGKLGWINCDRFYEVKNTSTLAVRVNSDKNMVVRLVFRDINSVMPAYSNSNHKDQYEASGIPKGEKVLLLAYSVKDNNAVFGYKEVTIGENKVENITLNNLSKARFKSAVSELLSF